MRKVSGRKAGKKRDGSREMENGERRAVGGQTRPDKATYTI